MISKTKSIIQNLLLSVASVFVFLWLAEMGARLIHTANEKNDISAAGGVIVKGVNRDVTVGKVLYETNNIGLRMNRDVVPNKPTGIQRIMVLGDSYAFGSGLAYKETVSVKIEDILRETDPGIEVINASVSGTNTTDQHNQLVEMAPLVHPDSVILFFYTNDLLHTEGKKQFISLRIRIQHYLMTNSKLFLTIYQYTKKIISKHIGIPTFALPADYYNLDKNNLGWTAFQKEIIKIKEYCAMHNMPFLFVMIPSLVQLDDTYPFSELRAKVTQHIVENNIPMIDLFDIFSSKKADDLWISSMDSHWNDIATTMAAHAASDLLLEHASKLP